MRKIVVFILMFFCFSTTAKAEIDNASTLKLDRLYEIIKMSRDSSENLSDNKFRLKLFEEAFLIACDDPALNHSKKSEGEGQKLIKDAANQELIKIIQNNKIHVSEEKILLALLEEKILSELIGFTTSAMSSVKIMSPVQKGYFCQTIISSIEK